MRARTSSPVRSRGLPARIGWLAVIVLVAVTACRSPRTVLESFPPVTCTVHEADAVAGTATVRVDGDPQVIELGDVVFRIEYRSREQGRQLRTTVERASGEILQRVSYVVPGRMALRNQFGPDRRALTGEHEILPGEDEPARTWSCGVDHGGGQ